MRERRLCGYPREHAVEQVVRAKHGELVRVLSRRAGRDMAGEVDETVMGNVAGAALAEARAAFAAAVAGALGGRATVTFVGIRQTADEHHVRQVAGTPPLQTDAVVRAVHAHYPGAEVVGGPAAVGLSRADDAPELVVYVPLAAMAAVARDACDGELAAVRAGAAAGSALSPTRAGWAIYYAAHAHAWSLAEALAWIALCIVLWWAWPPFHTVTADAARSTAEAIGALATAAGRLRRPPPPPPPTAPRTL